MSQSRQNIGRCVLRWAAGLTWVAAVAGGTGVMLHYQMTPGASATDSAAEAAVTVAPVKITSVGAKAGGVEGSGVGAVHVKAVGGARGAAGVVDAMDMEARGVEGTDGKAGAAGAGSFQLAADKPTLLMFAHPKCSCTMASIEELEQLMARCGDLVHVRVIVFQPTEAAADWADTRLLRRAQSIDGVQVEADLNGALAAQFGARTSGQVFLYDRQGQLLFSGGITGSRGHVGDNAGLDAVIKLLREPPVSGAVPIKFAVFGCSLSRPAASAESLP